MPVVRLESLRSFESLGSIKLLAPLCWRGVGGEDKKNTGSHGETSAFYFANFA